MEAYLNENGNEYAPNAVRQWLARSYIVVYVYGIFNRIPYGRMTIIGDDEVSATFNGFTEMLIKADYLLDQVHGERAGTQIRFAAKCKGGLEPAWSGATCIRTIGSHTAGEDISTKAVFQIQVLYKQHASWQGLLCSRSKCKEKIPYRSVFELLHLMSGMLGLLPDMRCADN